MSFVEDKFYDLDYVWDFGFSGFWGDVHYEQFYALATTNRDGSLKTIFAIARMSVVNDCIVIDQTSVFIEGIEKHLPLEKNESRNTFLWFGPQILRLALQLAWHNDCTKLRYYDPYDSCLRWWKSRLAHVTTLEAKIWNLPRRYSFVEWRVDESKRHEFNGRLMDEVVKFLLYKKGLTPDLVREILIQVPKFAVVYAKGRYDDAVSALLGRRTNIYFQ